MHINVWDTFRSGNHALRKNTLPLAYAHRDTLHTKTTKGTDICSHKHMTHTYMHKHSTTHTALNICKSIWAHKPNLHPHNFTHLYKHTERVRFYVESFLASRCRGKAALPTVYMPNTVDVMNGCNHNICIRAYTLWQTWTHCWAGFRVRDHFLPWGLGDGLLLFWPITCEHWLTPPAHWSWVINYQAVSCLGQMNISTWLPWNNEPHPKSLNRSILSAL